MICPGCGRTDTRHAFSGLGGYWKVLCTACGHRYDESNGEEYAAADEVKEKEN